MNGNITKEGIALDLDWMKRTGLGGFQNFDAALNTPQVVEKRLIYMTPGWKDAFLFATKKADALGLEMAIAGSPGWSESGGPWVQPKQAMKKFVWSETYVEGGKAFSGVLAKPPTVSGPFGSLAQADGLAMLSGAMADAPKTVDYYADSTVVAYRLPEASGVVAKAKVTSSSGDVDGAVLQSGDLMKFVSLPKAPVGQSAWIQFEYAQPTAIRGVTFALGGPRNPLAQFLPDAKDGPEFESSVDGKTFQPVLKMPSAGAVQHTVSFAPVTGRFFRLSFVSAPEPPVSLDELQLVGVAAKKTAYTISEVILHQDARVNRFEEKAAFAVLEDLYPYPTPAAPAGGAVLKSSVVDLTGKMGADGRLDWTAPAGRWVVLRMGYSLTGITNHPAPPEATGPEVDKLNKADVTAYFTKYLDNYQDAVGADLMGKKGVKYVITDSWEAGTQNWTDDMLAEFATRRGYDPHPWLPVLTGRVVESSEASDRFLWDFRKTIADLLVDNHYGTIAAMLHARGMGQYGESHEDRRATIGDGMAMKKADDVPMSAMWVQNPGVNAEQYGFNADVRESASVAHIYGQNLVAAESLTARSGAWAWSPATLKPTADKELAEGLNRFVIHTSVHQPLVGKAPGLALGPFGQWFNRNEIWAEQAGPWIEYLARSSYLLQQGQFVADVLYFYGEDNNLTSLFANKAPGVPAGYNFDYVNADALVNKISAKDGRLVTAGGMSYRVLALDPNASHMSLAVMRKLRELALAGVAISGARPVDDPSLGDDQAEFQRIGDELWKPKNKRAVNVFGREALGDLMEDLRVAPDFSYTKPKSDTEVLFVHRKVADGDLYYVDNRRDRVEEVDATFRVAGKEAELWHADTGRMEAASYSIANGRTTVPLHLEPYETVFVVFRKDTTVSTRRLAPRVETSVAAVDGPWKVAFEEKRGEPARVTLDSLSSWSDHADAGVRYFSGHGTYAKNVTATADWFAPGAQLWLDLGNVANVAEVRVNGIALGTVWKAPYRVDVTKAMKPGVNRVEVRVANLWVNRLVGDLQPGVTEKFTFTARNPYKASSPLLPSGLLGPVRVVRVAEAR